MIVFFVFGMILEGFIVEEKNLANFLNWCGVRYLLALIASDIYLRIAFGDNVGAREHFLIKFTHFLL